MQTETLGFAWVPALVAAGTSWLTSPSQGGGTVYYDPRPQKEDNTGAYVGIGVAAVAGIGLIWALSKKKKR